MKANTRLLHIVPLILGTVFVVGLSVGLSMCGTVQPSQGVSLSHEEDLAAAPEPDLLESTPSESAYPPVVPLEGPLVVALQPGHWLVEELPAEHAHRRTHVGAVHQGVREVDINIAVIDALVPLLEAEGWIVKVVPATVPPGLRADAFLSIHADWGSRPALHGWKIAAPWRPSAASNELTHALRASFRRQPALREDVGGVTVGMRGYYGFASHRFHHASSPYTPVALSF